ncbi:MAG: hypothetical protein LBI58_06610, partial [Tannerellaceae bacterium]|nr:hypothetical protein [Tannerellaceae bacterium]
TSKQGKFTSNNKRHIFSIQNRPQVQQSVSFSQKPTNETTQGGTEINPAPPFTFPAPVAATDRGRFV